MMWVFWDFFDFSSLKLIIMKIGLEVPYAPVFNNSALPESYNSLVYERAGVLFNLGALYCQLGATEDRTTPQGLKQAIKFYQVSNLLPSRGGGAHSHRLIILECSRCFRPPVRLCRAAATGVARP